MPSDLHLTRFESPDDAQSSMLASVLYDAMRIQYPMSYPDIEHAQEQVRQLREPDRFAIVAMQGHQVIGWIGAIRHDPQCWELHPLCIEPKSQRTGLGSLLVLELERAAMQDSVRTIWLGTEDEMGVTSLHGRDIWSDPLGALQHLELHHNHPIAFYRRMGFAVTGVIPDATGEGMPDFIMAKRVSR